MIKKTITMKSLLSSKRTKAILGIGLIAIVIGAISKKVINNPNSLFIGKICPRLKWTDSVQLQFCLTVIFLLFSYIFVSMRIGL